MGHLSMSEWTEGVGVHFQLMRGLLPLFINRVGGGCGEDTECFLRPKMQVRFCLVVPRSHKMCFDTRETCVQGFVQLAGGAFLANGTVFC